MHILEVLFLKRRQRLLAVSMDSPMDLCGRQCLGADSKAHEKFSIGGSQDDQRRQALFKASLESIVENSQHLQKTFKQSFLSNSGMSG